MAMRCFSRGLLIIGLIVSICDSAWAINTRMRFTGPFRISSCGQSSGQPSVVKTNIRYDLDFRPLPTPGSPESVATILLYTENPHSSCEVDPLGSNCINSFPLNQRAFLPNPREVPISVFPNLGGHTFHLLAVGFSMASGSLQISHTRVTPVRFMECSSTPAPLAVPGTGFSGAIPTSVVVPGTPAFLQNQTTVAHWALEIQRDRLSSAREIGVIADNASGIARVDFSVNGGPTVSVSQSRYGKRHAVPGYYITVDPSNFTSGSEIEIRAVVYPNFGKTAVLAGPWTTLASGSNPPAADTGLASLVLYADPNNSMPRATVHLAPNGSDTTGTGSLAAPFQTFARAVNALRPLLGNRLSGGTIAFLPGHYVFGSGLPDWWSESEFDKGYLTIEPASGVSADQVVFDAPNSSWMARKMKVRNVTFTPPMNQSILRDGDGLRRAFLVADGVDVYSPGNTSTHYNFGANEFGFKAVLNSYTMGGSRGVDSATFANLYTYYGTGIAFYDTPFIFDSTAENYDQYRLSPVNHGDLFHIYGRSMNIIIEGLNKGLDLFRIQGVFVSGPKDGFAIRDSVSDVASREKETGAPGNAAPIGGQQNMIIRNSEFIGQANVFTSPASPPGALFVAENVSFPLNSCNTFNEDCNTATGNPTNASGVVYLETSAAQMSAAALPEKTIGTVKPARIGKPVEISKQSLRSLVGLFPAELGKFLLKEAGVNQPAKKRKSAVRKFNKSAKSVTVK